MKVLLLIFCLFSILNGHDRLALIIANEEYQYINSLDNPIKEVNKIDAKLKELGFKTYKYNNLTNEEMLNKIDKFNQELSSKKEPIAFFYYSGHGSQVDNQAYLIPTNVDTKKPENIRFRAIKVEEVLSRISQDNNYANILIIDACRDVPLGNKGGEKGLGQIEKISSKSLVLFSTQPGKIAKDNSTFNKIVLKHISKVKPFLMVVNNISREVAKETNNFQIPTSQDVIFPNLILNENLSEDVFKMDNLVYQNQFFSKKFYWEEAKEYCTNLEIYEYKNWRLPTQKELEKLGRMKLHNWKNEQQWKKWIQNNINNRNEGYFIANTFLHNMPKNDWFWVSENISQFTAYGMSFSRGILNAPIPKTNKAYALCVQEIKKVENKSWWKLWE